MNKNKGITLIALVITIIILLILAGITIAQLSNNGLFQRTNIAKEKYKNSQDYEDKQIDSYSNEIEDYVNNGRDYTPIDYSTSEQKTGFKWTDGKPIYQKTILATVGTNAQTNHGISNLENVVHVSGIANGSNKRVIPFAYYGDAKWYCGVTITPTYVWIEAGTNFCNAHSTANITIQYTKTTD